MNKKRLQLCAEFANAETLDQKKKREDEECWKRIKENRELAINIAKVIRYVTYKNRPWYKKIFN